MSETIEAGKTLDDYFRDWEGVVFGLGYGTGEAHTLAALKRFMELIGTPEATSDRGYDYRTLERELTPTVAWLLINILGNADLIEYGTSPRFGWLTAKGERLRSYLAGKSVDELEDVTCGVDPDYIHCYPDHCNCEPERPKCANPFWSDQRS